MTAIDNAKGYAWKDWLMGIMRSFLSGGAVALCTGTGGAILSIPGSTLWKLMLINFLVMGLYRLGEFLQLHGAPDAVTEQLNIAAQKTAEVKALASGAAAAVESAKTIAPNK